MKVIKYKICNHINYGTKENPDVKQIIIDALIECKTQADFDANYPIAEKEAVGEIIVEGEFDKIPESTPTQLDRVESQIAYLAMMTGYTEILEV